MSSYREHRRAFVESLESRRLLDGVVLDPTFGGGGRAVMPFADGRTIGLQPGGKMLIARYNPSRGGNQLMRLNADGSLDPSFTDMAGDFPLGGDFYGGGHRVNPDDGRIVYFQQNAASQLTKVSVLRADGSRDTSFDGDGVLDLADRGVTFVTDIEWQGGKLLYQEDFEIVRLNADGSLDTTFGDGGVVDGANPISGFQVDADGRIYQFDDEFVESSDPFAGLQVSSTARVMRRTADGDLDTTYGGDGRAVANTTFSIDAHRGTAYLRVERDGSAYHIMDIFGGESLTRLDPDGDVAARHAYATHEDAHGFDDFLTPRGARSLVAQPDGKLLMIGGNFDASWEVTRFNADLTFDRDFGVDGTTALGLEMNPFSRPLMQPDGKLVVGGRRTVAGELFEVDRFAPGEPAAPTVTLNANGVLTVTASDQSENVELYVRQRDGRLVARVGDFFRAFAVSAVKKIAIFAGGGADAVEIGDGVVIGAYVDAGDGKDTIHGGAGNDILYGGTGPDRVFGFDGNDKLLGGGGNDYLLGGAGKDDLFGNAGVDKLSGGGGNDRIFGGAGADRIFGGAGTDSAADSDEDQFTDVETLLQA